MRFRRSADSLKFGASPAWSHRTKLWSGPSYASRFSLWRRNRLPKKNTHPNTAAGTRRIGPGFKGGIGIRNASSMRSGIVSSAFFYVLPSSNDTAADS
jgi:hypothetical protein